VKKSPYPNISLKDKDEIFKRNFSINIPNPTMVWITPFNISISNWLGQLTMNTSHKYNELIPIL